MNRQSRHPATGSIPLRGDELPQSTLAEDPMTLLWQNAEDRETGADAVEQMRARRKSLGSPQAKNGRRFRR